MQNYSNLTLEHLKIDGNADIVHNVTSEALLVLPFCPRGTLHDELQRRAAKKNPFSESSALELGGTTDGA